MSRIDRHVIKGDELKVEGHPNTNMLASADNHNLTVTYLAL